MCLPKENHNGNIANENRILNVLGRYQSYEVMRQYTYYLVYYYT